MTPRPLFAVVCHDAGAAAILAALVAHHRDRYDWCFFSIPTAPAWEIAVRGGLGDLLRDLDAIADLAAELDALHPALLVYGTGWQRQLQLPLLAHAKARGIPRLAVLDHWGRYRERFGYPRTGWRDNLPEHIAVVDSHARAIAEELGLPNLVNLRNYHYADLLKEAEECRRRLPQEDRLLLLSEPTARVAMAHFGRADYWGFTEREYFMAILAHFPRFGVRSLAVRLHPSDAPELYQSVVQTYPDIPCSIETSAQLSLINSLVRSRWVIGLDSFALYAAHLIGLPAVSYLPGKSRRCSIPLPVPNRIRDLMDLVSRDLAAPDTPASKLNFGMAFPDLATRILAHRHGSA